MKTAQALVLVALLSISSVGEAQVVRYVDDIPDGSLIALRPGTDPSVLPLDEFPKSELYTKERVIGSRNSSKSFRVLQDLLQASSSVCRMRCRIDFILDGQKHHTGEGFATGFLVGKRLLLTNHHVLPTVESCDRLAAQFNYVPDHTGLVVPDEYTLDPSTLYVTNKNLDYTLVALGTGNAGAFPGIRWKWLSIVSSPNFASTSRDCVLPSVGEFCDAKPLPVPGETQEINIVHHPNGRLRELGFHDNFVVCVGENYIAYTTDTEEGSSGSPLLSNEAIVLGLHSAGCQNVGAGPVRTFKNNVGYRTVTIYNDIATQLRAGGMDGLLDELSEKPTNSDFEHVVKTSPNPPLVKPRVDWESLVVVGRDYEDERFQGGWRRQIIATATVVFYNEYGLEAHLEGGGNDSNPWGSGSLDNAKREAEANLRKLVADELKKANERFLERLGSR